MKFKVIALIVVVAILLALSACFPALLGGNASTTEEIVEVVE
jgi:hypothetical protein